jgi:hypothetical protein
MRRALQSVDPGLPFSSFESMTEIRGESFAQQRYLATLFSILAGLALLLTVLAFTVWWRSLFRNARARWESGSRWGRPREILSAQPPLRALP